MPTHDSRRDTDETSLFPRPAFGSAQLDTNKVKLPQCIAHRGYKAKYPENTLAAFEGAVKVGAHGIETDVHLTKDNVVVISHDATLKRCYGRPEKIIDCTWDEIKNYQTIAEPHQTMPRLLDVLSFLTKPGQENIWLFLDIKIDNNPDDIMRLIANTIDSVPSTTGRPWHDRIILGVWAGKYLPLARKYSPGFSVFHIAFSIPYARHFFSVPQVGFNMLFPALAGPGGRRFLRDATTKHHRQVMAWTVNTEDKMEWCIRRGLDGVMTDDPVKFLEVCKAHDPTKPEPLLAMTAKSYYDVVKIWVWVMAASFLFMKRFLPVASRDLAMSGDDL